ncbi:histidine kinase [Paenibacillus darwinianus]|uniref:Histidine kinase n=1 Tax=Paenibacillus darwinianus TaxID=1380763 RepID=A0A9W5W6V7_9BACL|nr:LytTR family DNA-binding domain-containing protein [Paenibacillus darwinianus]EXX85862.1 histidine kinase [Paenibacillus darwinianus]EXX87845.1 histidine kinase [Paenibacillus darwinianus]EXX88063.1 histidine kinase [Paenibacillus darwinianus]
MKSIKVMIAEDERLAREELAYLLRLEKDLELLPSAANGAELLELAGVWEPDVVFLDVQMPEMEGIQAARMLTAVPSPPLIVFTTAHEDYAVEAFGLNAVDYLLKPYTHLRLKETLSRIRSKLQASPSPQAGPPPESQSASASSVAGRWNRLLMEDGEKHVLIDPEQVVYAVREERVVLVHLADGTYITSKQTLQELEDKLASYAFFRPHRSYLVNLNRIDEVVPWFNGAYNLTMRDRKQTPIPLSREAAKELFRLLKGQ